MWLSLVERFVRDEEVAGSNPVIPIGKSWEFISGFFTFYQKNNILLIF